MLKLIYSVFLCFLAFTFVNAQTTSIFQNIESNIFVRALQNYANEFCENEILLEYNSYTTNRVPEIVGGCLVRQFDKKQLKKLTRGKNEVDIVRITPIKIEESKITVSVLKFRVSRKGKNYSFINHGGLSDEYKWDCDSQKWRLLKE